MTANDVLLGFGTGSELILLMVLLCRKVHREMPILTGYIIYLIISDPGLYACYYFLSSSALERLYVLTTIVDVFFQTGIILEIGATVVAPMKPHVPQIVTAFIYSAISCSVLTAAWISNGEKFAGYDSTDRVLLKFNLGFSVFRVLALLGLFLVTRILGVGWHRKAVRVAIGVSFYAVVALAVNLAHELGGITAEGRAAFANWERISVAGWIGALWYLTFHLSRKERQAEGDKRSFEHDSELLPQSTTLSVRSRN